MRSRVAQASKAGLDDAGDGGQTERCRWDANQGQDCQLYLRRTDLLADVIRRAADHEPGKENGDDAEQQHAVQTGARSRR
jgi:hypothetical protein